MSRSRDTVAPRSLLSLAPQPPVPVSRLCSRPGERPRETTLASDLRLGSAEGRTSAKRRGPESDSVRDTPHTTRPSQAVPPGPGLTAPSS